MPTKKIAVKKNPIAKEEILKTITEQLLTGLTLLKEQLGDKKFEKRIKKAAKLLTAGIKHPSGVKPEVPVKKNESPVAEPVAATEPVAAAPKKKAATKKKAAPAKKKTVTKNKTVK